MPAGDFRVTDSFVCQSSLVAHPEARLLADLAVVENPALQLGDGVTDASNRRWFLPQVVQQNRQWAAGSIGGDVGVRVDNSAQCDISLRRIEGFSVGLLLAGDDGTAYHSIYPSLFLDCGVAIKVAPDEGGFVNECVWVGGRCAISSGEGSDLTGTRFLQLVDSSTVSQPNNHVFVGMSLEGDGPEFQLDCDGASNLFLSCRWERPSGLPQVRFGANANRNTILAGFDTQSIDFTLLAGQARNSVLASPGGTDFKETSGVVQAIKNRTSDADPAFVVLSTATDILNADPSADYGVALLENGIRLKRTADPDADPRMELDAADGKITSRSTSEFLVGNSGSLSMWGTTYLRTDDAGFDIELRGPADGVLLRALASGGVEVPSGFVGLPAHTDATRPAVGTAGRIIFNTDDGQLNIDDGTNWTLPDGTVT